MRNRAGKILIRVPSELHKELAQEAFENGRSISQLCLQTIVARKVLRKYDPWKAIEEIWKHNRKVKTKEAQSEILRAISEVRHGR